MSAKYLHQLAKTLIVIERPQPMKQRVKMHVTYRPKPGKEEELLALIRKHGPALQSTGLIVGGPAAIYLAADKRTGGKFFTRRFASREEDAPEAGDHKTEGGAEWGAAA